MLKSNTSGYTGVYKGVYEKWSVQINVNKKRIYIGSFDTPHEAAKARNEYIVEHKLLHTLNKIEG